MTARPLTAGERRDLSPGLAGALAAAGATPMIENRAFIGAHLVRWRFGGLPIVTVRSTIWWPDAAADFAGTPAMATLQHELQHVLDFADGWMTPLGYLIHPRHWTYRWRLAANLNWDRLGAEQRAAMAEALWRAERGDAGETLGALRQLIPWASA
jgi:hypothetical protein